MKTEMETARDAAWEKALLGYNFDDAVTEYTVAMPVYCDGFEAGVEYAARGSSWVAIESAPKDGTAILLLSKPYHVKESINGDFDVPAKAAIGYWDATGSSWVAQGIPNNEIYKLRGTGFWASGGGWFQPDEVSHWMPIPPHTPNGGDDDK